jgi:glycosidase
MGARGNPSLNLDPPTETTLREMRMMLLHQFTFISAPYIWNGDEFGMWGADDPDCRKPIIWEDIDHRPQMYRPDGTKAKSIAVKPNPELLDYVRTLVALRKKRPELIHGKLEYILANDESMTLAYRRSMAEREMIVVFNRSDTSQIIRLKRNTNTRLIPLTESRPGCIAKRKQTNREIRFDLAPLSGVALGTVP